MILETLGQIETKIRNTAALPEENRRELLTLLADLKSEVATLSRHDAAQARSITAFTDVSTHEATRERKQPQLLDASLSGLKASVDGFEQSHPKLVEVVNRIATALSNLGI